MAQTVVSEEHTSKFPKSMTEYAFISDILEQDVDTEQELYTRGWIKSFRKQRGVSFIILSDGSGSSDLLLQCTILKKIMKEKKEKFDMLMDGGYVELKGSLSRLPEGKTAPCGFQYEFLIHDFVPYQSEAMTEFGYEIGTHVRYTKRHLTIRRDDMHDIFLIRASLLSSIRRFYEQQKFIEITPPHLTQQAVEGGATLFELDYYGEKATLTQSSQLYLETFVPVFQKIFCIQPSFRAEKSLTRRHLSEFTHCEAEASFMCLDDLLDHIEQFMKFIFSYLYSDEVIRSCVSKFKDFDISMFDGKFVRMTYQDAIEYCRAHEIYKDDEEKTFFEFGDDIPEASERAMVDMIGKPVFLTHFPKFMKSFYMLRSVSDPDLTESVDLLLPEVGEVFGGSMRIYDKDALEESMCEFGLAVDDSYQWYIDLRKYGSCPHGGYGMGIERILLYILGYEHSYSVKDCIPFPRFPGHLVP